LTPEIALGSFRTSSGLDLPKWELPWECEGSLPHTPSHFLTLPRVCDVTPGFLLSPHPYDFFALTPGLPLGPHPCKPFALVVSPRLGLRHLPSVPFPFMVCPLVKEFILLLELELFIPSRI